MRQESPADHGDSRACTSDAGGGVRGRPPGATTRTSKERIHRALLNRLNLDRLNRVGRAQAEPEIRGLIMTLLDSESSNVPLSLSEREALITDVFHELFGLGPLEALLADAIDLRHPGQPLRPDLRRARRPARTETAGRSRTTSICCGSSSASSARSAAASTSRARWSTPACRTARASTRSSRRWRSTARCCRFAASAPTGSARSDLVERQSLTAADARVPEGRGRLRA